MILSSSDQEAYITDYIPAVYGNYRPNGAFLFVNT